MEWWDDQPQGHHKNHHWPCPSFLSSSTPTGPVVYDPSCHDVASVNLVLRNSINDKCGWISPGAKWQEHKCSVFPAVLSEIQEHHVFWKRQTNRCAYVLCVSSSHGFEGFLRSMSWKVFVNQPIYWKPKKFWLLRERQKTWTKEQQWQNIFKSGKLAVVNSAGHVSGCFFLFAIFSS